LSVVVADDLADNLAVLIPGLVEPAAVAVIVDAAESPPPFFPIPLDELLRPDLPGSTLRSVR